jgi:hypothetical protein
MNKEEVIGKEFNLDLGSLSPVSMTVMDITNDKVIVEYLNSTPGRIGEFSISDFEYFACIKLNKDE